MKLEIEIPVSELKPVLLGLGKVINRSTSLPVLGCVKVSYDRNHKGAVQIQGTNLDDYVTGTVGKCVSASSGEMLVPYEELNKIVKGCSAAQSVRLSGNDKETQIRYPIGNSFAERKLSFVDLNEWPESPVVKDIEIAVVEDLKSAIRQSLECADHPTRYAIQSSYLDLANPKAHYVVGTNGSILYSANSFVLGLKQSLIIPNRKFLQWTPFWEDGGCSLSVQPITKKKGGWIQFRSERWTFITKQIEGQYPDWRNAASIPSPVTTLRFNKEAVQMLLNAAPKMPGAENVNKTVTLAIEQDHLLLQARQSETDAWTTIPIMGVTVTGKPMSISLNRDYLIKALQFGLTDVELVDSGSPLVFKSGGRKLIVMPVRPDGVPKSASEPQPAAPVQTAESSESTEPAEPKIETSTERTSMPKAVNRIEQHQSEQPQETKSSFEQLQGQIEQIKETLRGVVSELNGMLKTVAQAHKEKRATEKEIDSIRDSLKEIQSIQI
jgi:DNA polymerase III sliding clamp (beta) subunit (PCNA family)